MEIEEKITCPECDSTNIDLDPYWEDDEVVGSIYICRDCGWSHVEEEESAEDHIEGYESLKDTWVKAESLFKIIEQSENLEDLKEKLPDQIK